jgi:predicted enzyme related to lactoylglutathione lyase
MQRVTGIGGIFFTANDPVALRAWYHEHLGIELDEWGGAELTGPVIWNIAQRTPQTSAFTINYRVADLNGLLAVLRTEGCEVSDDAEDSEYGKFGWVVDPEGNKVELWEP